MFSIRDLDESIFEGYRKLRLRALKEEPTAFTSSWAEEIEKSEEDWKERMRSPLVRMFCAVRDGHVLGMAGCLFEAKKKKRHKATLIAVYVEPESRGQGLGRKLTEATLKAAFEDPRITSVKLSVTNGNSSAIRLYKGMGFKRWGEEPAAIKVNNAFYSITFMELSEDHWKNNKVT